MSRFAAQNTEDDNTEYTLSFHCQMRAIALIFAFFASIGVAAAQTPDSQQIFRQAAEAQQRGDLALAVSKYQEVIRLDPNVVAAHANLGVALSALGRFDDAITQYHIALAEAPGDPALRMNLGLAHYKKGDFAAAAAQFASLHKENPGDLRIATLLGNCQLQVGLASQAAALLEPLEKDNADNLDLEWALGNALIQTGHALDGLERVQKVADKGNNAEAFQLAANLSIGLTLFDQARRDAEAVLRLNPNAAKAHVVLGMIADFAGDAKNAEVEYRKALEIDPKDLQARLQLANAFLIDRKLNEAQHEIDQAIATDPNSMVARYELARVERAQGNLPAALQDFETVSKQDPDWLQPHVELAALYYRLQRPSDGDREKEIVNRLRTEERERRGQNRIISPRVPLP
ncbi:MAG TPA: tetratricopeptide repeat protein [Candidatus Dormibacteraeota bacterium]|nr:tetratricopeptide repeat protein [Candidatus Dormibacteraeota bacterium]